MNLSWATVGLEVEEQCYYQCRAYGLTQPPITQLPGLSFSRPTSSLFLVVGVDHGLHRSHGITAPHAATDANRPT